MYNNSYTLITGASEGFGKSLALECAQRKMNLILVALPGEELQQLGQFIESEFSVKTVCLAHDLTVKEECQLLLKEVTEKKLSVNMLINNAGIGGTHFFKERDAAFYQKQIELNVTAPTLLIYLFLKILQDNSPSYILNVSSLAGFFCMPMKQVYGGTKSYLLSFSKSLHLELKPKNIFVSTVCPGGMNTTLAQVLQNRSLAGISRWSVMNPEEVARITINKMMQKKEIIIPGYWNRFFLLLNRLLPGTLKEWILLLRMKKTLTKPIPRNRYTNNHTLQTSSFTI